MLPEWLRQYLIERGLPATATDAEARAYLRQHGAPDYTVRELAIPRDAQRRPLSWDETTRSVEVVVTSETPVQVYDWQRDEVVDEVLLMDGLELPQQTPLLDAHNRWSVTSQLGSARDYRVQGTEVLARISFADTATARDAANLMRDGHLTDVSVGARLDRSKVVIVAKGEKVKVGTREFSAGARTLLLHRGWQIREVSVVPIGADPTAKARNFVPVPHTPNRSTAMPQWLRTRCEALGLATTATEDEAWRFYETKKTDLLREAPPAGQPAPTPPAPTTEQQRAAPPAQPPAPDETAIRAAAVKAERERVTAIRNLCQRFSQEPAVVERFINDGCTIEEVERTVAQTFLQQLAAQPRAHFQAVSGGDERDKLRAALADGLSLRLGLTVAKPAAGATEFRGLTAIELVRECLRGAGQNPRGEIEDVIQRAISTSDFPHVLSTSVYHSIQEGFQREMPTWQTWAEVGPPLTNFETQSENRPSETGDLDEIGEGAEYPLDQRSETDPETYRMAKYGKIMAITEELIRADRLAALVDIGDQHGRASARKVAAVVYAVLTANGNMGDGKALFHADHANLATLTSGPGSTSDIGTVAAKLARAAEALRLQKDPGGLERLNIPPTYLVCPVAMYEAVEQHFGSYQPTQGSAVNVFKTVFAAENRVYDPRLDNVSRTAWYVLGPKGMTVRVRFLDGKQTPTLSREQEFRRDAVLFKVKIGVTAYARDWRGMYSNPGA